MVSKLIYLLTCFRGIRDVSTGFFSYMDIFDTIFIPKGNDFVWVSFCVGGRFCSDADGDLNVEISFRYHESEIFSAPVVITGNVHKGDVHFAATFPSTRFTEEGKYILRITVDGKELENGKKYYFKVVKQI